MLEVETKVSGTQKKLVSIKGIVLGEDKRGMVCPKCDTDNPDHLLILECVAYELYKPNGLFKYAKVNPLNAHWIICSNCREETIVEV